MPLNDEINNKRRTLKTTHRTAWGIKKGCRAKCNEKYEIGSEEWEQCMRDCQAKKVIG